MKIKTWELNKQKNGLQLDYEEDFSYLKKEINDLKDIEPVKVKGLLQEVGGLYTLSGHVSTQVVMQCSRCLTDFKATVGNKVNDVFVPQDSDIVWDEESNEDEHIHSIEDEEIDVSSVVEEAILLEIPLVPVCHDECKGLCPSCGINLNESSCECKIEKIDPRLADLAKLFDQTDTTE